MEQITYNNSSVKYSQSDVSYSGWYPFIPVMEGMTKGKPMPYQNAKKVPYPKGKPVLYQKAKKVY